MADEYQRSSLGKLELGEPEKLLRLAGLTCRRFCRSADSKFVA